MNDFNEFRQKYKDHLQWLGVHIPELEELEKIYKIFSFAMKNGGWVRTIGLDQWKKFGEDARRFFETHFLVSFERKLQDAWPYSAEVTKGINFSLLESVPVKTSVRSDEWEEVLAEDMFLYRNVYNFGIREDLISLESIQRKHGNIDITVILQESDTTGCTIKQTTKQTMRLKDYIKLMQSPLTSDKYIRFAVNIDFGNWQEEVNSLRKSLPSKILWCSDDDALKNLRQHILGMTLPQLYLKINGCWTGGHEENLRFPSANINHGPSACEWWGLDSSQSLQLRECIKRDKCFEIYNSETLWWPDEIYCLVQGLRVYHGIQLPGDLVVVGAGTIHWVKSLGVTTNTAWNFGPKYLANFQKSFERMAINEAIKYKNLVPMNILSMDLLNNEMNQLDVGLVEYLKAGVVSKAAEELQVFKESGLTGLERNNLDNVIHCEVCYQELLRIYYKCAKCEKNRMKGGTKQCFFCYFCMKVMHLPKCKGKIVPVEKFSEEDFQDLMKQIDLRCEGKVGSGVESLKYPVDKNVEEGVYVSLFNGVKFGDGEDGKEMKIEVLNHPEQEKKFKQVSEMIKKKKKKESDERVKLRSFPAKRRMGEGERIKKCKGISDLRGLIQSLRKEEEEGLKRDEREIDKVETKVSERKEVSFCVKNEDRGEDVVKENTEYKELLSAEVLSIDSEKILFDNLPFKRKRSTSIYLPVMDKIPTKNPL